MKKVWLEIIIVTFSAIFGAAVSTMFGGIMVYGYEKIMNSLLPLYVFSLLVVLILAIGIKEICCKS